MADQPGGDRMANREPKQAPDAALRFRIPPPPHPPAAVAYAVAVVFPMVALAVQVALRSWMETIPFVLFFLATRSRASSRQPCGCGSSSSRPHRTS